MSCLMSGGQVVHSNLHKWTKGLLHNYIISKNDNKLSRGRYWTHIEYKKVLLFPPYLKNLNLHQGYNSICFFNFNCFKSSPFSPHSNHCVSHLEKSEAVFHCKDTNTL